MMSRCRDADDLLRAVERTSGDITSLKFNGIEAQDSSKRSHIVRT